MSRRFRLIHRWVSLAFLATVVLAVGGALGLPEWLFYLPLAPLLLLMVTGIWGMLMSVLQGVMLSVTLPL